MANWSNLKASVAEVIKTNGNQEITGQILQNALNSIISNLGENATFAGIATPMTNPGVPDGNVFYLANEIGEYSNFGGLILENTDLVILYNVSTNWHIEKLSYGCLQDFNGASTTSPVSQKGLLSIFKNIYRLLNGNNKVKLGALKDDGTIDSGFRNWRVIDKVEFYSGVYIRTNYTIENEFVNYITYSEDLTPIRKGKGNELVILKENNEKFISVCYDNVGEVYIGMDVKSTLEDTNDKIANIEELLYNKLDFSFRQGYINNEGNFVSHILHQTTDFISCESLIVSLTWNISTLQSSFINFYDREKQWIKELSNQYIEDGTFVNKIIKIPSEAYFVRVTAQNQYSYSGHYIPRSILESTKAKINRNVNFVGMSIWWYDGEQLASGMGGEETAVGYQTLLKEKFSFLSDTGTTYCYSGNSLGALNDEDASSICNKMSTWVSSSNALWTLDTITNDFKHNIPIGTINDYNNNTGKTTYFGALRIFTDKIQELSGDDKVVIVSNSLRRNNSGYTSTSKNTAGHTLLDYEKALMEIAVKNKWWFVDQFRLSGVTDETISLTTIDGLHLNNLGYKLAVIPWMNVISMFENR